jgi:hypothetical protein
MGVVMRRLFNLFCCGLRRLRFAAYLRHLHGPHRLDIAPDEIFDFEGRAQIGIHGLIRYLEQHQYTAFVAQMIEMLPKQPLSEVTDLPYDKVWECFRYFDLSAVDKYPYHASEISFSLFSLDARRWNRVELLYRGDPHTNTQTYTNFVQSEAT